MKYTAQPIGRPREFDELDVLDNVMTLFWEHGYEGTAMADIMKVTGLAKGSIYKAFKSKHNLYLKSLERYEDVHIDTAVNALMGGDLPLKRVDNFLSAPINDMLKKGTGHGCFLCNASADRAEIDAETRDLVLRGFDKLSKALTLAVRQIQPEWNDKHVNQSAQLLLSVYSGLRIMSRAGVNIDRLTAAKLGVLSSLM